MANYLQTYATSVVYVNNSILMEEASVSIKRDAGSKPLITLHRGYAGDIPGAEVIDITVESNIPADGIEFDPGQFMIGSRSVEFNILIGKEVLAFEGTIYSDNFSHAVNSNASLSFNARGKFSTMIRK